MPTEATTSTCLPYTASNAAQSTHGIIREPPGPVQSLSGETRKGPTLSKAHGAPLPASGGQHLAPGKAHLSSKVHLPGPNYLPY